MHITLVMFLCRDSSKNVVLITLLTPAGGNDEVTRALEELLNVTFLEDSSLAAAEFNNLSRFGK